MSLSLQSHISILPGVGPTRATQLEELGILTIKDLLFDAPFRYQEVEREIPIAKLVPETTVCVHAKVVSKIPIKTYRFKSMLKVKVADPTGTLDLTWFNNSFILSSLKVGEEYYFTGKVSAYKGKLTITNPTVEHETPEFGSLVPIYHESSSINSRYLRKLIRFAIEHVDISEDPMKASMYERQGLISLRDALEVLHQTAKGKGQREKEKGESEDTALLTLTSAKKRLAFDEMFFLIQQVMQAKTVHQSSQSVAKLSTTNEDIQEFFSLLPYAPTPSQREAIQAISLDLVQKHPMHRLIQGEVGSGKTTVAAFALWVAAKQGTKSVLICPTNILASQHYQTLQKLFKGKGENEGTAINSLSSNLLPAPRSLGEVGPLAPTVGLFTGKEKDSEADILVGTHALFNVKGLKPSVVVIDEEHRFGVNQRESFFKLKKKPHFLSMTATPIPRTVALTALADRDVSFIVPHKDNSNIKTWVTPKAKRLSAYQWIKKTLKETGGQALIVCPFIEESLVDTLSTVKSAKKEFESLRKIFTGFKLDLLHGKLKPVEKEKLFEKMMEGGTDILVTTPVVEVGVDIPKANIVVIEGAERYGLAQLHQLRGRVGRRGQDAYCLLFTTETTQTLSSSSLRDTQLKFAVTLDPNPLNQPSEERSKRLLFFASTYDGNALAEYDLKHRGSGELLGLRQHGFDTLKFASWFDMKLIDICKKEVELHFNNKS